MRILIGDSEHGRQIAHEAGVGYDPEIDQVIARITVDGKLMGGFVFTNYNRAAVQIHMAGFMPRWCTLELLVLTFHYPFEQLGAKRVIGTVPSTNIEALKLDLRVGWKKVAVIPDAVAGGDMIVLSMSRDECRWLRYADRYIRRDAGQRELAA